MDVDYFSAAHSKYILAECIHRMSIQKHPAQLNLKQGEPERKNSKSQRKCRATCKQGMLPHTAVAAKAAMGKLKNYLKVLELVGI